MGGVLAFAQAVALLYPVVQQAIPAFQSLASGLPLTPKEQADIEAATAALNARAQAAETAAGAV